jgi:hypothetical protein
MTRRMERAELLDRLCELRDAYKTRGPDDRATSAAIDSQVDQAAKIWEHAPVASEPGVGPPT